ncbi:MAG TPA: AsmA-like C-terminal region-containing protein [Roseomonas sp.]
MTFGALLGFAVIALCWRLAQGPVDLPFLATRIEAAVNSADSPTRIEVGRASIAWGGWRDGHASPFEIVLRDMQAREANGTLRAEMPQAAVSLSLPWLLHGQFAPRSVELRQPSLRVFRAEDGSWQLDLGSLAEQGEAAPDAAEPEEGRSAAAARIFADLMRPASDDSPLAALQAVTLTGGRVQVLDRQLGRSWMLDRLDLRVRRQATGGISGRGQAMLRLGDEVVPIGVVADAATDPARITIGIELPVVQPAALARAVPALAPLAALDAGVALDAEAVFDLDGKPLRIDGHLRAGAGAADLGQGHRVAIAGFDISGRYEGDVLTLGPSRLSMPRGPAGIAPEIRLQGEARRVEGSWRGGLDVSLDAMALGDLAQYWPEDIGRGARLWMTGNITAGIARNGHWRVEAEVPEALDDARVTNLTGHIEVEAATVHWLRPVPPAENARGSAEFGLDEINVQLAGGRQQGGNIVVRDGTLRFYAFSTGRELTEINVRLAGPVPDVMALLRHPRLKLFERRATPLPEMTGQMTEGRLAIAFPLIDALPIEQLRIGAQARLEQVRIARALLGQDITRGAFDLTADTDGMRIQGNAQVAEVPARLAVEMDFRSGNAQQVVSRESLTTRAEARQLAALGFDARGMVDGPVALDARHETRRNGQERITLRADLRDAGLALAAMGWSKARGQPATLEGALRLQNGVVQALDSVLFQAPDALARLRAASFRGGLPERLEILEGRLGESRFQGDLRAPRAAGAPWEVALRGPMLDLSGAMERQSAPDGAAPTAQSDADQGTPFAVDVHFDRVLLGPGRELTGLQARAHVDERAVIREARASGRAGDTFEFTMTPVGSGPAARRNVNLVAADAGSLLRAFDVVRSIDRGRLSVTGAYDSSRPGALLRGQAEMSDFAVRDAPAFGKLMQAMTVYGLFEAASGPGLGFSRMVAPFVLAPDALVLDDARAFSASLGLTARGRLDRRQQSIDMQGTIVPAYVFNTLLGNIPLLGRLFSPERGGGLFAVTYRMRGPLADPAVSVNPLSALTPGFLRGIFGIGDSGPDLGTAAR